VRGILLQYDTFDALSQELEGSSEDQALGLASTESLREGEWLLATFSVGDECVSIAACAMDRGAGLCLSFAERDWDRLWRFAEGRGPSLLPPSSARHSLTQIEAPPDTHVLVVDDYDALQGVLGNMLTSAGFAVTPAATAEDALDRMREAPVDLVVLDWNLPGMTGIEFCARLRQDPRYLRLPVLFLTARSCTCELVEAFGAGADDFVSKPFRALELGARIISLLRRAQLTVASPA
jgi:two-component system, OmpR family, phosphate regulon response regulator PhoB